MIASLLTSAAANGTGPALDLGFAVSDDIGLEIITAGTVSTMSVQINGSEDGVNFFALGSALTVAGLTKITSPPVRYLQAVLSSLTGGGNVTAIVNTVPLS